MDAEKTAPDRAMRSSFDRASDDVLGIVGL